MDALVYAVLGSLDYLGERKKVILGRINAEMARHLVYAGEVSSPEKPAAFARSLEKLLVRNGYVPAGHLRIEASRMNASFPDLFGVLKPGTRRREGTSHDVEGEEVEWVLYEMVLYGMTKALDDQLGAQAQLVLERVGTLMLDYLVRLGEIKPSDDLSLYLQNVVGYFIKAGYTRGFQFEMEGAPPDTWVSRYESAPYFAKVLKRLRNEGSALFSCPLCLTGQSIWISRGWKFGEVLGLRISPGDKVTARSRIYPPGERFTEEDAKRFARMRA